LNEIKAWCGTDDLAAADEQIVHGVFDFCHRMLNSRVKRCLSSIYDPTPEKVRATGFDLVFMGDLLVHTMAPLLGLNAVANLCRGTLVIAQDVPDVGGDAPVMLYCGGETRGVDDRSWWLPNKTCWVHMLKRLGGRRRQGDRLPRGGRAPALDPLPANDHSRHPLSGVNATGAGEVVRRARAQRAASGRCVWTESAP
jgi:hypothetical protein